MTPKANNRPMLNVYPDSLGGTLHDVAALLGRDEMRGAFSSRIRRKAEASSIDTVRRSKSLSATGVSSGCSSSSFNK